MMGFLTFFTYSLLALASLGFGGKLYAQEGSTKVLDLNQVDMEQVDDNWENQSQVPKLNPSDGLKIKDIVEPTSEYTYASFGKPDPFSIPSFAKAVSGTITETGSTGESIPLGSKEITVTSPLQAYPLNVLVVKGVWQTADGEFRSIIQTPKKEGIVVKIGDPISSGKILGIDKEAIMVRLYKLRKDGVREYEDSKMSFGNGTLITKETIKLEPGKDAQFPGMDEPASGDTAKAAPVAAPAAGTAPAPPPGFINPDLKKPDAAATAADANKPGVGKAPAGAAPAAPAAQAPSPAIPVSNTTRPGASQ